MNMDTRIRLLRPSSWPWRWQASAGVLVAGSFIGVAMLAFVLSVHAADEDETDQPPEAAQPAAADEVSTSAYEGSEWQVVRPGEQAGYNQRQTQLHRGRRVYDMYCAAATAKRVTATVPPLPG